MEKTFINVVFSIIMFDCERGIESNLKIHQRKGYENRNEKSQNRPHCFLTPKGTTPLINGNQWKVIGTCLCINLKVLL
jgi:hypothetical protein